MNTTPLPSVDTQAPNGQRIVLHPVVQLGLLPGISRRGLAVVIALCAIWLVTSFHRLGHTDLWGHLNFGRWIAQNGTLPAADPFRPFADTEPVLNTHWLSQLIGYGWHEASGLEGLVLAHVLLVTLTAAGLMAAVRGREVATPWAVAAAAAGYLLALPITGTIRPQLFGMLAFTATLYAIARLPWRIHPLFWLPAVFVIWANLHGSFAVGLAVLGCFAAGWSWEVRRATGSLAATCADRGVRRTWLALLLATAASCLNPAGVRLLAAVAGFSGNANLSHISEWQPMTLGSLSGGLFFGSLLITAVLLRFSPRRILAPEILLILVFGTAALLAIRMLVWWALVWPWVMAPHAAAAWLLYRRTDPIRPDETDQPDARARRMLLAAAVIFATLWWSPPSFGLITGRRREEPSVLSTETPCAVAGEMVRQEIAGRTFAPMDWADYLVWRTGEAVEPLVHSHVHLSSPRLWSDFRTIRTGGPGWLGVADRYGLQYLVISRERNRRLAESAVGQPRCRVLYEDRQALLVRIEQRRRPLPPSQNVSSGKHSRVSGRRECSETETSGRRAGIGADNCVAITPYGYTANCKAWEFEQDGSSRHGKCIYVIPEGSTHLGTTTPCCRAVGPT